jgi:uncharacterized protein (TIGR02145 family)
MKKVNLILILFVCLGTISFSQTVTIGTQVWMTKNLDVSTFRNGDQIPEAKTFEEWEKAGKNKQPAWRYYDNDPKNGEKYGKLYNWYAVSDPRGLAPEGWRVPSNNEWTLLETYLGRDKAGVKMKSKSGWKEKNNGTNRSGFSGLPGGCFYEGNFTGLGYGCGWWSSTASGEYKAFTISLGSDFGKRMWKEIGNTIHRKAVKKRYGYSVRCIIDIITI